METKSHPLFSLKEFLETLRPFGDNAVLRRAINHVQENLEKEELACSPDHCGPDCGPRSCLTGSEMNLADIIKESISDDRRISTFIDPKEAIIFHLLSFYSGRTNTLELRTSLDDETFSKLEGEAIEYIKNNKLTPLIKVNFEVADSKEEIIDSLKDLIHVISEEKFEINSFSRDNCTVSNYESLGGKFINDAKAYQRGRVEILTCRERDGCCSNRTVTRRGNEIWETVWQDGDSKFPPPVLPPNFQERTWNNELPFFPSPVTGKLASDYGFRRIEPSDGRAAYLDFHPAIDVAVKGGTQVLSVDSGTLHFVSGAGHRQGIIVFDGRRASLYMHIDPANNLRDGQSITPGMILGTVYPNVPTFGHSSHLHYAIYETSDWRNRNDNNSVNPLP